MKLSWEQVRGWRLARQHLDARVPVSHALDVVSRLCGLHAQLASSAELTLWARVEELPPGYTARALWEERSLVKTWAMRGTLHLLRVDELPVWLGALATYDHYLKPAWSRMSGFDPDALAALNERLEAALDGRALTREELAAEIGDERLKESWGALLKPAAFQGRLCFAEGEGQRVRFTRPPRVQRLPPEAALEDVARRFLGAYAPATREDFARWWAGLTPARSARLLASVAQEVELDGARVYVLPEHSEELDRARPAACVRLLPAFDQYVVGATRHAERLMGEPLRSRVYRDQGWLSPVLLVDGRMEGVWRHERKGRRVAVTIEPFGKVQRRVRLGAEAEAQRLAAFLGAELSLEWRG